MGESMCSEVGGILPEPRSEEENNFLKTLIEDRAGARYFAIGMRNEGGSWLWRSDDSPVTWFNWRSGHPIPGRECVWYDAGWKTHEFIVYRGSDGHVMRDLTVICQRNGRSSLY